MATVTRHPTVVPTTITLDVEAKELLKTMTSPKTYGAFLSGLIRAEAARKTARQQVLREFSEARHNGQD